MRTIARHPFVVFEGSLLQLGPELGCGALSRTVGKVEDCRSCLSVFRPHFSMFGLLLRGRLQLTLLDAVLLGTALILLLAGDALDALIVVVLGRVALLGLLAFCCSQTWSANGSTADGMRLSHSLSGFLPCAGVSSFAGLSS